MIVYLIFLGQEAAYDWVNMQSDTVIEDVIVRSDAVLNSLFCYSENCADT